MTTIILVVRTIYNYSSIQKAISSFMYLITRDGGGEGPLTCYWYLIFTWINIAIICEIRYCVFQV